MRRLSNKQMDVLAERVTDVLEQEANKSTEGLRNSEEYVKFFENYSDDYTQRMDDMLVIARQLKELDNKLQKEVDKLRDELGSFYYNSYRPVDSLIEASKLYKEKKRKEKYPEATFDRDRVLRRVQADILLSDVTNPEELVRSLVEKLKINE